MADDEQNIDPRFDPAFQRGFEGVVGTTRRRPTIGTPSVLPAQQPVSRPTAPAYQALPSPQRPQPPEEPVAPRPVVETRAESTDDDEREPGRRFNPFLVALAVIGVVLVALGGWSAPFLHGVFTASMSSGGTGSTPPAFDYLWVLMSIAVPPILVGLGVATLISMVVVSAIRWRR